MSAKRWYYVCDKCGNLSHVAAAPIPEGASWECAVCGSDRAWEFTNERNAFRQSQRIQAINVSGLFR